MLPLTDFKLPSGADKRQLRQLTILWNTRWDMLYVQWLMLSLEQGGWCISHQLANHNSNVALFSFIIICAQDVLNPIRGECMWHPANIDGVMKKKNESSAVLHVALCTDLREQALIAKESSLWASSYESLTASHAKLQLYSWIKVSCTSFSGDRGQEQTRPGFQRSCDFTH